MLLKKLKLIKAYLLGNNRSQTINWGIYHEKKLLNRIIQIIIIDERINHAECIDRRIIRLSIIKWYNQSNRLRRRILFW